MREQLVYPESYGNSNHNTALWLSLSSFYLCTREESQFSSNNLFNNFLSHYQVILRIRSVLKFVCSIIIKNLGKKISFHIFVLGWKQNIDFHLKYYLNFKTDLVTGQKKWTEYAEVKQLFR